MQVNMCVCVYALHNYICVYMYVCMYVCYICVYMYVCMYVCVHIHLQTLMYDVYMCVCVCVCVCVY